MRIICITCILLAVSIHFFAQTSKIDSLEREVGNVHGKMRVAILNDICLYYLNLDLEKAELAAEKALHAAKLIGDKQGLASAYANFGNIYLQKNEYLPALDAFHKSMDLSITLSDEAGKAASKLNLGKVEIALSDYLRAKADLTDALAIFESKGDKTGAAECHDLLAEISITTNDLAAAKSHCLAAQVLWGELNELQQEENSALNLAKTAFQLGDYDLAEVKASEVAALAKNHGNKPRMASCYALISYIHLLQNELELAGEVNELSIAVNLALGNELGLAENNLTFGEIALARGDKANASIYLGKSSQLLVKQSFTKEKSVLLKRLLKAYEQMGNFSNATAAAKYALEAEAILAENEITAYLKTRHRLLSERLSFINQQEKIAELQVLNSNDKKIRALMIVLIGLAGLLSAVVYILYRKNLKDNEQLQAQNEEILQQKAVFDELNKELGIKNISLELLNKKLVEEIAERENIERSSFARDRFLVAMSREMRNPLNVITGLTYLLLENNPRPDQGEQLRSLQFSANELVVFINEMLDFSKIEAGKINMQSREFSLGDVANSIFNSFVKKAEAQHLLFYCSLDTQIPRKLIGDDSRFCQILTTLLHACLESTKEGMIRAEIFLHEENEKEVAVRMVVESPDGGILHAGINLEKNNLWNMRENLEGVVSPWMLSLTIIKRLVELQNGRFDFQNMYGEATRFSVFLPFKKAIPFDNNILQITPNNHAHLQGSQILLVEDNKINQLVVSKLLGKYGISVITADNGFEALELIESHDFDLILMDIQMPEMDGYRATSEIRKLTSFHKKSVPIIALTSSAYLTEKDKAVLFGMNDYVGKPFSPEELLDKIAAHLVPKY